MASSPVLCIVGARPNFMKIAPIVRAFEQHNPPIPYRLIHTGQHYDVRMSEQLFADLGIPAPHLNLEVHSGSHAQQTAAVMARIEPVIDESQPSCILVVGDVNSTLACALVASKKGVPVVHVEAGLRSYDRAMPEEINRVLTDAISDVLFTTEASALPNLQREGIAEDKVIFVGNVMIDSVLQNREHALAPQATLAAHGVADAASLAQGRYALATLHRPSNVDEEQPLRQVFDILCDTAQKLPVIFPAHPRTHKKLESFGWLTSLQENHVHLLPPVGYLEILGLMQHATVVLTDSGGLQEETTALGVPCLTVRENTERPITIEQGTNVLVGRDRSLIAQHIAEILSHGGKRGRIPALWDGRAAERIADHLWRTLYAERAA
ncbi:MAG: UDP-N-acetylglucosamine 2-epimerase (non-hydrolyzing) [Burkholderiaceae bacterium]|nr:MAG: UDP-N-acetylglucosamine 2-epimerase (non-hydrolyzing) [Burkholderiaceae bacterium]